MKTCVSVFCHSSWIHALSVSSCHQNAPNSNSSTAGDSITPLHEHFTKVIQLSLLLEVRVQHCHQLDSYKYV